MECRESGHLASLLGPCIPGEKQECVQGERKEGKLFRPGRDYHEEKTKVKAAT